MDDTYEIRCVRIIYFSGTGGTKRIAEAFHKELKSRGIDVVIKNLGATMQERKDAFAEQELKEVDFNILLFAVYAMDAPRPVYDWIANAAGKEVGRKIAVFSVSGGGEMWPNKGARNNCCKMLENKGFQVVYDRMMCMPANIFIEYNDHLVMWLISVIPKKVSGTVGELLRGKVHRTHFRKGFLMDRLSKAQRENSGKFVQRFRVTAECISCGWCEQNCPMSNIKISAVTLKPVFLDNCVMCVRCVYGCPARAIKANALFAFKNGYDLDAVEQRMQGVELEPLEKCCRGWLFKGVKNYLLDKY